MRTIEHARHSDHLGRYYTKSDISALLAGLLTEFSPSSMLDLGSGEGSLALAASSIHKDIDLCTVDVDIDASHVFSKRLKDSGFRGKHHHFNHDALDIDLQLFLSNRNAGPINSAICNPPFMAPRWRMEYGQILEDAGLSGSIPAITSTDSSALFLAQNLRLLKQGGVLGIIVPDSLVCADKYRGFRASLLQRFNLVHAIRLPRGSFYGTDALAHILIIEKKPPASSLIKLSCFDSGKSSIQTIHVERDLAIRKLDYFFHASEISTITEAIRIREIVSDLRRGRINSAEVRRSNSFVLHTTSIDSHMRGKWMDFSTGFFDPGPISDNLIVAEAGDIVIGRLGRNSADKVVGIASGRVALSDCLFRLQVQPEYRDQALLSIASESGKRWLEMHSGGVASRHISKTQILNFPLN